MLQYIGARYVPIFYQNSLDPTSSEWEVNVTYEPMVWVSLPNGHMYISKKEVPANIGSPASNPDYWLEAGQYNAYIQSLQDQIDDMNDGTVSGSLQNQINDMNDGTISGSLQNQIDDINSPSVNFKRYIMLGDSWGTGYASESGYGWTHYLKGLVSYDDCYDYSENSMGFAHAGSMGHTFKTLLEANVGSIPDHNTIDCIIVAGGYNDNTETEASINTAINAFVSYAESEFPNAKIYVIACNTTVPYNPNSVVFPNCYASASQYGRHTIGVDASGCVCGKLYAVGDALHLSDAGYKSCAMTMLSILRGSSVYAGSYIYTSVYSDSQNKINLSLIEVWENGSPHIYCGYQQFFGLGDLAIAIDMGNTISLTRAASDKPFNVPLGVAFNGHGRVGLTGGTGNYAIALNLTFGPSDAATLRFDCDYTGVTGTVGALIISEISGSAPKRC